MKDNHANTRRLMTLLLLMAALFLCLFVMPKRQQPAAFDTPPNEEVRLITLASPAPTAMPDPIAAFKESRQSTFSDMQNALSLIAQTAADQALLDAARDELKRMTAQFDTVCHVETALCAMGYPDALCAADEKTVTVFFQSPLTESDALLLRDLIVTWTDLPPSSVLLVVGV